MNTSPLPSKPTTVKLEDGASLTIVYDRRAERRMGSLKRPIPVNALNDPDRAFAALTTWIWACISDKDDEKYPSPDAIAMQIGEELVQPNFDAFYETWHVVQPPKDPAHPLTNGSTTGPSPASSSS